MTYFVGMDAFSQALAHPLLSENVWTDPEGPKGNISEKTFGKYGVKLLSERKFFVKHLLERTNTNGGDRVCGSPKLRIQDCHSKDCLLYNYWLHSNPHYTSDSITLKDTHEYLCV